MYNYELQNLYQTFGEHILLSLCRDYNNYFTFKLKEKSKLSTHILDYDISKAIIDVCYNLIKNGKYTIYSKLEKEEELTYIKFSSSPISNKKIDFIFPSDIVSNYERKKVIRSLTQLDSNKIYRDGMKWLKFMSAMKKKADLEIGKLGKNFYIYDANWSDYYNDYYYVHREIKEMIAQRKLINYVLDKINLALVDIFKLKKDDIILFNGMSLALLYSLQDELEKNNRSVNSIYKELHER